MKTKATAGEQGKRDGNDKRLGTRGKIVLAVSFALVFAAFLGTGLFDDKGQASDVSLGDPGDIFEDLDLNYYVKEIGPVSITENTAVDGEFTLDEGYLYKIVITGAPGEDGEGDGGTGGAGAVVTIWIDTRSDSTYSEYTYQITDGGAGSAGTGSGSAGGAGGKALVILDASTDTVAVAAGGGGGGGGSLLEAGDDGVGAHSFSLVTGTPGNGFTVTGDDAGGNGGGGAGYEGGAGGADKATDDAGGSGGDGGTGYYDSASSSIIFHAADVDVDEYAATISVVKYEYMGLAPFYVEGDVLYDDGTAVDDASLVEYTIDSGALQYAEITDGHYKITAFDAQEVIITDIIVADPIYAKYKIDGPIGDTFDRNTASLDVVDFEIYFVQTVSGKVSFYGVVPATDPTDEAVWYTINGDGVPLSVLIGPNWHYEIDVSEYDVVEIYNITGTAVPSDFTVRPDWPVVINLSDVSAWEDIDIRGAVTISGAVSFYDTTSVSDGVAAVSFEINGVAGTTDVESSVYTIDAYQGDNVEMIGIVDVSVGGVLGEFTTKGVESYYPITTNDTGVDLVICALTDIVITVVEYGDTADLTDATVWYTLNSGIMTYVNADAGGKYTIHVADGDEVDVILVELLGYTADSLPSTLTGGVDTGATIEMVTALTVSGTVVDAGTGLGMAGVEVSFIINEDELSPVAGYVLTLTDGTFIIVADTTDTIRITDVDAGTGYIVVDDSVFDIVFEDDSAEGVDILVGIEFTVEGTIFDAGTGDEIGATITYEIDGVEADPIVTIDGTYAIIAYIGQTVVITDVDAGTGYIVVTDISTEYDESTSDADIEVGIPVTVGGTVIDAGTGTGTGATITYEIDGVAAAPIVTADGTYTIVVYYPQTVVITNVDAGTGYIVVDESIYDIVFEESAAGVDIIVGIPFTVTGKVLDADGEPIEGAVVTYETEDGEFTAITDASGEYELNAYDGQTITVTGVEADGYVLDGDLPGPFTTDGTAENITMDVAPAPAPPADDSKSFLEEYWWAIVITVVFLVVIVALWFFVLRKK